MYGTMPAKDAAPGPGSASYFLNATTHAMPAILPPPASAAKVRSGQDTLYMPCTVHEGGERLIKLGTQKNAPSRILVLPFCSIASHGQSRDRQPLFIFLVCATTAQIRQSCLAQIGVDEGEKIYIYLNKQGQESCSKQQPFPKQTCKASSSPDETKQTRKIKEAADSIQRSLLCPAGRSAER